MDSEPIVECPNCTEQWSIALWYSEIFGCCYRCQNCDEEFPLKDVHALFKENVDVKR